MKEDDTGTEGHVLLGAKSQCGRDGHRRMMLEYGIPSSVYHPKGCERLKAAQRRIPEMMQQLVYMVNGGSEWGLKTQYVTVGKRKVTKPVTCCVQVVTAH